MKKECYRLIIIDSNPIIANAVSVIAKQRHKVDDVKILSGDSVIKTDIADVLKKLSDEYRIVLNADSIFKNDSSSHVMKGLEFLLPIFNNGYLSENDPLILSFSTLDDLRNRDSSGLLMDETFYRFAQLPVEIGSLDTFLKWEDT